MRKKRKSLIGVISGMLFAVIVIICTVSSTQAHAAGNSLKILSIGNSFSVNATTYLYQIAKEAGYDDVVIGDAYIKGKTIKTFWTDVSQNKAEFTYEKNTSGSFVKKQKVLLSEPLMDEAWDFVVLQQSSKYSGLESSYNEDLEQLAAYVKTWAQLRSPLVKLAWHMTWAYKDDSTADEFKTYNYDSTQMYEAIVSAVKNKIETNENFSYIIPSGTAIRNLQTSYLRNNMFKDNKHMNDLGCYVLGLTFIKTLTQNDIDNISWIPTSDGILESYLPAIYEAVDNAYDTPFAVTASKYKCNHERTPDNVINTLLVIPAVQATCSKKGLTEGVFCYACDKFIEDQKETPVVSHDYSAWTIIKKASAQENGYKACACKYCGKLKTETINKASVIDISNKIAYTGSNITPELIIKDSNGKQLLLNTDYTVKFPSKSKNVGTYTVKITFKGNYTGTVEATYKIVPRATTIKGVNALTKGLSVSWSKKTKQSKGYEIQYSTSKKFTKKTTKSIKITDNKQLSTTIYGLKSAKKYYVRVRTYKTVNKVNYYSAWSKRSSVKTY